MATQRFIFAKTEQMLIQSEMETFASEWIEVWIDHDQQRVHSLNPDWTKALGRYVS